MSAALSSWKAWGTSVHVVATESDELGAVSTAVSEVLADVDTAYSRFREDSELSRLNASPGRSVRVSPLLATAIDAAQRAARLTDGAVDPTIGHALRVVGYDDDFSRVAAEAGPLTLLSWRVPGWQAIRFDRHSRTVLLPQGVELDFGSTGKALAADLAARAAHAAAGGGGVLVSLGGDIAMAGTSPSGGWRIHVAEDSQAEPDGDGEVICLPGGGVATSSTTVRRWTRGTAVLHHIIDPKTSLPATGPFRTVTVAAATCLDANIASTAAIVRGEAAIEWLMARELPARLVENDGTIHYIGRWPDPTGVAA